MSYVEQTWATGDTITAEKLNHMESGIAESGGGSSAMFVTGTTSSMTITLDKNFTEIKTAFFAGTPVFITVSDTANGIAETASVIDVRESIDAYETFDGLVHCFLNQANGVVSFEATSADAYPSYYYGD